MFKGIVGISNRKLLLLVLTTIVVLGISSWIFVSSSNKQRQTTKNTEKAATQSAKEKTIVSSNTEPTPPTTNSTPAVLGTSETPKTSNTTNTQPTPVTSQPKQTVDPNIKIELCKTKKQQEIDRYMQIGLDTYKKEKPDIYALANAQNKGETETLALQYAYITQSQVVHYADYFQKLLNEGVPMEYAKTQAQAAGDAYYAYLTNLHNWAKNQLDSFTANTQSKANDYGNEVYTSCLKT